ncbi:hypothetical protein BDR03DRAFT_218022 [Suillus americanus]|nr:hypothetical protein BDR03DRAFT_218022 [Suillus americanus]
MSTPTQLWAHVSSKELALISFTLVLYDHAITFAEEVNIVASINPRLTSDLPLSFQINFFWTGPWSASRTLYLSVMPWIDSVFSSVIDCRFTDPIPGCDTSILGSFWSVSLNIPCRGSGN